MAKILCIETSASALSVCLTEDCVLLADRVCNEPRQQAALTAPLVKEVLDAAGCTVKDCDAICVSAGPGSYTGLRVGVSTAKGLAFGAGKPLIAVGTLDILVQGVSAPTSSYPAPTGYLVPMIDARRMEVYTAVYGPDGQRLTPVEAMVVGEDSFADYLSKGPVLFIGDGALKCSQVIKHPNATFLESAPMAKDMVPLAFQAYKAGKFEDTAYFEPFYLKDFIATVSRKQLW